jgi:hypothetical protein
MSNASFIHELRRELCGEVERWKNRVLVLLEENRRLKKELADFRKASNAGPFKRPTGA